jgi:hypothetical protein
VKWRRILLLEFVVIILGVFAALAADSWWGGRTDHARMRQNLVALGQDLAAAEREIRASIENDSTSLAMSAGALALLRRGGPDFAEARTLVADTMLSSIDVATIPYGTLRFLINSGDVRLVQDDSARGQLIQGLANLQRDDELILELAGKADAAWDRITLAQSRFWTASEEWPDAALEDPEVIGGLAVWNAKLQNIDDLLRVMLFTVEDLKAAVERELAGASEF